MDIGWGKAVQPWEKKGLKFQVDLTQIPKGAHSDVLSGKAMVEKNTNHNYPAPISIVSSYMKVFLLPIDKGLEIEAKYFVVFSWTRFREYDQEFF
ncbi:MAG: hypothetical protein Ct9H90mP13_11510 [Pseudomonadota bacterium]|nr:MAG: hypothetical protein Ct9H90mP13_11510 [Pseudomonadota bacterium]